MGISCLLLSCVLVAQAADDQGEIPDVPDEVSVPEEAPAAGSPAPMDNISPQDEGMPTEMPPISNGGLYNGAGAGDPSANPPVAQPPATEPAGPSEDASTEQEPEPPGGDGTGNWIGDYVLDATKEVPVPPQPTSGETRRPTVSELIADAIAVRPGVELEGAPATLVQLLGPVSDRAKRLRVAHAYWELVDQVAGYGVAVDEWELISQVPADPSDTALANANWESAEAAVASAKLNVAQSQYRLAEAVGMASGSALPLPGDQPHVGAYHTRFESLFSSRSASSRLRLIDRTLPIRASAIAIRLQAVHAAQDAMIASGDAYVARRLGLTDVYTAIREHGRQHRLLFASVRRYNDDIADYALTIAGPEVRGRELVSTLIELAPGGASGASIETDWPSDVRPAQYLESLDENTTLDPRLTEPTPASRKALETSDRRVERTTFMQTVPAGAGQMGSSFLGLVNETAAVRSKYVALHLHRAQDTSTQAGQAVRLADCLQGVPADRRAKVIEAYWLACQKAATHRALTDQVDTLVEIIPAVSARVDSSTIDLGPFGDGGGLALRAANRAAQAAARESQAQLLEAQYELTVAAGRSLDSAWLMPSTMPHAGGYALRLDAQPGHLAESWAVRRLAVTIPALVEALHDQADAVVQADSARGSATTAYVADTQPIAPLLEAIHHQADNTLSFLETLTAYNQAIAEYALTVLPSHMSGDQLVATMVFE